MSWVPTPLARSIPKMVLTANEVEVKKFDLNTLKRDPNNPNDKGTLAVLPGSSSARLNREGLNDTIKEVESMQETLRN